ncbi:hypothetical protein W03_13070 [Nitrosomonas sp. PY1]|uniref:DUF1292 domain-containing protein n=1 Tax=Nitrosomonas sp. PY1 TaxID=1803906 RepID=UPI001FC7C5AC|nr:DUF1292 domain-containing protein [Nitrosomonas sp. PY1]GKS69303.1 hypothetical protein W03_13070 [Nitrosomonas sp. PY1]
MKSLLIIAILLLAATNINAMEINRDPRTIISFRDNSISPELDILRVTTDISNDEQLLFRIRNRGESTEGNENNYFILSMLHNKHYFLVVPLNTQQESIVSIYETSLENPDLSLSQDYSSTQEKDLTVAMSRITNGVVFSVPIAWIDFSKNIGFDAYTAKLIKQDNKMQVTHIHDQAIKSKTQEKMFPAITLFNKLCAPKRLAEK